MALQTLNTIKQWFKTGLKPTQTQFWDTWDSFRHKFDKIPVKEVEGLDELLLSKADKTVLDHHLADKNAHAPQVNTDWNSESGFSQLINKPEFKTINGETIVGEGDITIGVGGDIPALQQVIDRNSQASWFQSSNNLNLFGSYGNFERQFRSFMSIVGESDTFSEINQLRTGITISNGAENNSSIGGPNKTTLRMFNGVFNLIYHAFNKTTNISFNIPNADIAQLKFPAPSLDGEYTLPLRINGQVADKYGDVTIPTGGSQGIDQVLAEGNITNKGIRFKDDGDNYEGLIGFNILSFNTVPNASAHMSSDFLQLRNNNPITGTEETLITNSRSFSHAYISDGFKRDYFVFPKKLSDTDQEFTLATTSDFKTINGESIIGSGDIAVGGGGLQNLEDVINVGSQAAVFNKTVTISSIDSNTSNLSNINIEANLIQILGDLNGNIADVGVINGKVKIQESIGVGSNKKSSRLEFDTPVSAQAALVKIPNKSGTIALLSDIPSGGSQNLQQVLDEGSEATLPNYKEFAILSTGDPTGTGRRSRLLVSAVDLMFDTLSENFRKSSGFGADSGTGEMAFFSSDALTDGGTRLRLPRSPLVRTSIFVPNKPIAGDYTLATTDDITLQKALDNGNTSIGKSIELTNTDFGTEHYLKLDGYECTMTNLDTNKYINFNSSGYYSRDYDTDEIASLSHNGGIYIAGKDSGGQTISTKMVKNGIEFRNPNVVTFLKILNQSTGGGSSFTLTMPSKDGTLATTDDIKLKSYTVSTLPTGTIGDQAYVTDATTPTYLGSLTGGGSVVCPVFYNGTTWVAH